MKRQMNVVIEFFFKGKSLGKYPCMSMSSQTERNDIAKKNGIKDYDRFVLDDGRAEGKVKNWKFIGIEE